MARTEGGATQRSARRIMLTYDLLKRRRFFAVRLGRGGGPRIPPPTEWRPRFFGPKGRAVPPWVRIDAFCRDNEIDPVQYLEWRLDPNRLVMEGLPPPERLMDSGDARRFAESVPERARREAIRLNSEASRFSTESEFRVIQHGRDRRSAQLAALGYERFSPLFRYCIRRLLRVEADQDFDNAVFEFRAKRDVFLHLITWRALLPRDLTEGADAEFDRITGLEGGRK